MSHLDPQVSDLLDRMSSAKQFLNRRITQAKISRQATPQELLQLGRKMDSLHEAERVGPRNLDDLQLIRLERLLKDLEEQMPISAN